MKTKESQSFVSRRDVLKLATEAGFYVLLSGLGFGPSIADHALTPDEEALRMSLLPSRHLLARDTIPSWVTDVKSAQVPWTVSELDSVWDGVRHIPQSFFDHWFAEHPVELFLTDGSLLGGKTDYGAFALPRTSFNGNQGIGVNEKYFSGKGQLDANDTLIHELTHLITMRSPEDMQQWEQFVFGSLWIGKRSDSGEEIQYRMNPQYKDHELDNWRECIATAAGWYTKGRDIFNSYYENQLPAGNLDILYCSLRDWLFLGHEYSTATTALTFWTQG